MFLGPTVIVKRWISAGEFRQRTDVGTGAVGTGLNAFDDGCEDLVELRNTGRRCVGRRAIRRGHRQCAPTRDLAPLPCTQAVPSRFFRRWPSRARQGPLGQVPPERWFRRTRWFSGAYSSPITIGESGESGESSGPSEATRSGERHAKWDSAAISNIAPPAAHSPYRHFDRALFMYLIVSIRGNGRSRQVRITD